IPDEAMAVRQVSGVRHRDHGVVEEREVHLAVDAERSPADEDAIEGRRQPERCDVAQTAARSRGRHAYQLMVDRLGAHASMEAWYPARLPARFPRPPAPTSSRMPRAG